MHSDALIDFEVLLPDDAPSSADAWVRHGFNVEHHPGVNSLLIQGRVRDVRSKLGVELHDHAMPDGVRYPAHDGEPVALEGTTGTIVGLDRRARMPAPRAFHGVPTHPRFLTVPDLGCHYRFPGNLGAGQKIGIVILGGGLATEDLEVYFRSLDLPHPSVDVVEVAGAVNNPLDPNVIGEVMIEVGSGTPGPPIPDHPDEAARRKWVQPKPPKPDLARVASQFAWTTEALMDVEVAGAVAPEASLHVYVSAGDPLGIARAIRQGVADGMTVISCSFGSLESDYDPAEIEVMSRALEFAAGADVTVVFSSGDKGSTPGEGSDLAVRFPGSSAHVLSVGGTQLTGESEIVWNEDGFGRKAASGGGFSARVERPPWQVAAVNSYAQTGRAVPDVAANAAFHSGAWLWIGEVNTASAGTSAAAPLWAGLIARLQAALGGTLGFLPPLLYSEAVSRSFSDVTQGNNKISSSAEGWDAGKGWDPCSGWGVPDGEALLGALRKRLSAQARTKT